MMTRRLISFGLLASLAVLGSSPSACKSRNRNAILRDTGGCSGKLTSDQEIALVNSITALNVSFLRGDLSREERDQQTGEVIQQTAGGDAAALREATATAALAAERYYGTQTIIAAMDYLLLDGEVPKSAMPLLASSVEPDLVGPYLAELAETLAPWQEVLEANGAAYEFGEGWNFAKLRLNARNLKGDSRLFMALSMMVAPQAAADLAKVDRAEAVVASPWVFLPPRADGSILAIPEADWRTRVTETLRRFEVESRDFMVSVRQSNTYWNMMSGRLGEVFTGRRQATPAEINAEGAYKRLLGLIDALGARGSGVSTGLRAKLFEFMQELNNIEARAIESGLAKANAAQSAALAAPFVPLTMYFAPYAAYLANSAAIPTIKTATATAALIPLTFGIGSAVLHGSVVSLATGQPIACNLYENLVKQGSSAVYQAPYVALLPVTAFLGSEWLLGWKLATPTAETVKGTINVAIGLKMAWTTASSGIAGGAACYEAFRRVVDAGNAGDQNLVNSRGDEAIDICTQAGIDIGVAAVRTGYLAKDGYALLTKQIKFVQPPPSCNGNVCNAVPQGNGAKELTANLKGNIDRLRASQDPAAMNLTREEIESLGTYGGNGYMRINRAMKFRGELNPRTAQDISAISSALDKAPSLPVDMPLIRGERLGRSNRIPAAGENFKFESFVSTSIDPDVAKGFSSSSFVNTPGIIYEIRPAPGQALRGLYMPKMPKTFFRSEQEVLLPAGQNFRVVDVQGWQVNRGSALKPGQVYYVTLEASGP
jgi:hypothetical protein